MENIAHSLCTLEFETRQVMKKRARWIKVAAEHHALAFAFCTLAFEMYRHRVLTLPRQWQSESLPGGRQLVSAR